MAKRFVFFVVPDGLSVIPAPLAFAAFSPRHCHHKGIFAAGGAFNPHAGNQEKSRQIFFKTLQKSNIVLF